MGYWSVKCMLDDAKIEGMEEGIEKGIEKGQVQLLSGMVRDGIIPVEDAASRLSMSVEEFQSRVKEIAPLHP